jgi:hypothetical protein
MRTALGGVQQVRDLIGEDTVDLLRHPPVVGAQARFDVNHRNVTLRRNQRTGKGGVDVAHHQHGTRTVLVDDRFEPLHHLGGLNGMSP